MSKPALKQILKSQSPSLWMGFYMVFSWMLCAWSMVGVQGVGCSFESPLALPSTKRECPDDLPLMSPGRSGPAWQEVTLQLLVQEIEALVKWSC